MYVIDLLGTDPGFFIAVAAIFGSLIGSFLNVVIYRLPIMLERAWANECNELLEIKNSENLHTEKFNLIIPRSRCPACKTPIRSFENIPLVSYLLQKGKCRNCNAAISIQYPLIELTTAVLTGFLAYKFGFTWQCLAAMLLTWSLIALAVIDFNTTLLPDDITLPFLWLGLLVNYFELFCSLEESVIGAMVGYISLWLVFHSFKLITRKEGMGYGDFKLLALLGAWLGWQYLLPIILISSVIGSVIGITLIITKLLPRDKPIPFGPYLALSGIICLLWGTQVRSLLGLF